MLKDIFFEEEPDLTPIWITITYDQKLQFITGKKKERSMVNQGCPMLFILQCLFTDHPEIQKKYPPGVLGFTINGKIPGTFAKFNDGDKISFFVWDDKSPLLKNAAALNS